MPAASVSETAGIFRALRSRSVKTLSDWAVDGEPGAPKGFSTRAGDQAVLHEGKNLKLFAHLTAEAIFDCILGPFKQLGIPSGAVIQGNRWVSSKDVVWAVTIGEIRRQALPLRIVAPSRLGAVRGNENSLDRTGEAVIRAKMKLLHQRSKRVVFDRGTQRNTCVHREVPHRPAEAKPIDQSYGNRLVDRIDRHDFVVHFAIVHVSIGKVDLARVHTEGHDRRVVNHAAGIQYLHKGAVVCVADSTRLSRNGRKFRSRRSGNDVADRRKINGAFIK